MHTVTSLLGQPCTLSLVFMDSRAYSHLSSWTAMHPITCLHGSHAHSHLSSWQSCTQSWTACIQSLVFMDSHAPNHLSSWQPCTLSLVFMAVMHPVMDSLHTVTSKSSWAAMHTVTSLYGQPCTQSLAFTIAISYLQTNG